MVVALYFAAPGAGQVPWPLLAVTGRLVMTAAGVWAAARLFGAGLTAIFVINAAGPCHPHCLQSVAPAVGLLPTLVPQQRRRGAPHQQNGNT